MIISKLVHTRGFMVNYKKGKELLQDLFVLELANNHLGSIDRGKNIISQYSKVVRFNKIKAAIKLQIRDVDNFIHDDYKEDKKSRYITKTLLTKLSKDDYKQLSSKIISSGCIAMATPFDEKSVDTCVELEYPIIKIASSDANDWPLIEAIASKKIPTIVSTGGMSELDIDNISEYFNNRDIPLAINHCVSLYPSEDHELELDQIDYLKNRYINNIIGFSSHEYHNWTNSMIASYAKGARTWERHIDIDYDGVQVSKYNSLPDNIHEWFQAYLKAREICGGNSSSRRVISKKETVYLDELVRGIYLRKDLPEGTKISSANFNKYFKLAIPLLKGQLSCREIVNDTIILRDLHVNEPLKIDDIDSPYSKSENLRKIINNRGT